MISDWKIERYRLGEASAADKKQIEDALVKGDVAVGARLKEFDTDDSVTLHDHPAHVVAAKVNAAVTRRPTSGGRAFPRWVFPLAAALPVLALVAVGTYAILTMPIATMSTDVRLKGDGPALRIFRMAGDQPERMTNGAHVKPNDVVQVAFETGGAAHLVIVSVDGAHHTTLHWPLDGNSAVPQGLKAVPQAFELDNAPGFERFFLVTAASPISATDVMKAAEAMSRRGDLQLPQGFTQKSLLLEKGTP